MIFNTFVELAAAGELAAPRAGDLWRVAAGFGFGVVAGTLARRDRRLFRAGCIALLDPTLQALRAIPSIAWVPLFILWFGIFEASKITLIAVGVFFPVYLGVMGAVLSVDRKIVEVGRAFRLSGSAMVRRILLPAVLPAYVISLRAGLGLGWMFVVAAEFLGASEGLGYLLIDGQQLGKPAQIVAAIVAFAVLGKITDWLIVCCVAAPFLRWEDRSRAAAERLSMLDLERVGKTYPNGVHALDGVIARRRARRDRRRDRRLRLRQVDLAARDLRARHADAGHGACSTASRSRRRTRRSASSSRSRGCCRG